MSKLEYKEGKSGFSFKYFWGTSKAISINPTKNYVLNLSDKQVSKEYCHENEHRSHSKRTSKIIQDTQHKGVKRLAYVLDAAVNCEMKSIYWDSPG